MKTINLPEVFDCELCGLVVAKYLAPMTDGVLAHMCRGCYLNEGLHDGTGAFIARPQPKKNQLNFDSWENAN